MTVGQHSIIVRATDSKSVTVADTIQLTITDPPVRIALRAGWNYIGCPLTGSTPIADALAGIMSELVMVKDFDGFYDKFASIDLNSLKTVEWGQGYFVKVNADCSLLWPTK